MILARGSGGNAHGALSRADVYTKIYGIVLGNCAQQRAQCIWTRAPGEVHPRTCGVHTSVSELHRAQSAHNQEHCRKSARTHLFRASAPAQNFPLKRLRFPSAQSLQFFELCQREHLLSDVYLYIEL